MVRLKSLIAPVVAALAVAACEAQSPTPADVATGQAEGLPPTDDPTQPTPVVERQILEPLVRADWSGRLEPGAGCNLSRDNQNYLVIVIGDGVAKIGDEVVDLTGAPDTYDGLFEGGTFAGGDTTIRITPAPDFGEGDIVDETLTKPVAVEVTSAGRTERFDAAWTCGA